jgi:hypothetical protein
MSNFEQTGDGAVYTTLEELLLWDNNWYAGTVGGAALLQAQQVTGRLTNGQDHGYAGGLFLSDFRGLASVRHGGAWAGYRAELLRFPGERTSIACLCNRGDADPSTRADRVAEILFAGRLKPRPETVAAANGAAPSLTPDALAGFDGAWHNRISGDVRVLVHRDGKLYPFGSTTPLSPAGPDRVRMFGAVARYAGGAQPTLTLERENRPPEVYHKVAPVTADSAARAGFAGTWYSEELDAFWRLVPTGQGLRIEIRDRPSGNLRQVGRDLFTDGRRHLEFSRKGNRITGFSAAAGRVRGIGFVRSSM